MNEYINQSTNNRWYVYKVFYPYPRGRSAPSRRWANYADLISRYETEVDKTKPFEDPDYEKAFV